MCNNVMGTKGVHLLHMHSLLTVPLWYDMMASCVCICAGLEAGGPQEVVLLPSTLRTPLRTCSLHTDQPIGSHWDPLVGLASPSQPQSRSKGKGIAVFYVWCIYNSDSPSFFIHLFSLPLKLNP